MVLDPATSYAVQLNTQHGWDFQTREGRVRLAPYVIRFSTADNLTKTK